MAPSHSRQFLVWSLPTIAVILSYLWYKKKRIGAKSDPGETSYAEDVSDGINSAPDEELKEASTQTTPRTFSRSLSGVDTAPIDIVVPKELKSKSKSTPVIISDEDLDIEIEKVRSMKSKQNNSPPSAKSKSLSPPPIKEDFQEEQSPPVTRTFSLASQHQSPVKIVTPVKELFALVKPNATPTKLSNKQRKSKEKKAAAMAQKDIAVVEDKLSTLKISNKDSTKHVEQKNAANKRERADSHRRSSERDSANHSPADAMLASHSLSSISDNHSEKSTDSGKGGSDPATPPPPHSLEVLPINPNQLAVYEFIIPQPLVGKLIGRQGSFVIQIKEKTNAHIIARKHPTNKKLKVCSIEGTQTEIERALKLIREKFPSKRYPEVTLEQVHFVQPISTVPLIPDHLYLKLIEGINNDTILSCMVAPNHLFLQQPMHPTYPGLNVLVQFMNTVYKEEGSPFLPNPIPENTICAAFSVDSWYRAITLSTDSESDTSYVKFLDYGGYAYVDNKNLRQIRGDFLLLPFQAAECVLANIRPVGGDDASWAEEAYELVAEATKGALIYTQVLDYTEDGYTPLVFCYIVTTPNQPIYLNQLLVDHGYAEWVPGVIPLQEEPLEGAAGITV